MRFAHDPDLSFGFTLSPIAGSFDLCSRMNSISFAFTSSPVAVSDFQSICFLAVKSLRCSGVRSISISECFGLPK